MTDLTYNRGSVWWAHLNGYFQSSVQKGTRPVVIVSSLAGSRTSDIVMVAPLTTKIKNLSIEADIDFIPENGRKSAVQCNQIQVIPKSCLTKNIGQLPLEDLEKVDKCLLIALGISTKFVQDIKSSAEESDLIKKNKEALEMLVPQAKDLIKQLSDLVVSSNIVTKVVTKKYTPRKNEGTRRRRPPEEIQEFIKDWSDPMSIKRDVAEVYGFPTYSAAYQFYNFHIGKKPNRGKFKCLEK
jgi:mRNA-degrading endonuclease toxin of MazEF toxin-antitoxin module